MTHVKTSAPAKKKSKAPAKKPKTPAEAETPPPVASAEPVIDWTAIRPLYEDPAVDLGSVAQSAGLSRQKISHHAAAHGWRMRVAAKYRDAPASELLGAALKPLQLATRLKRLLAREIEAIESESANPRDAAEKERDARRLSTLVRSLEKLNDIKAAKAKREPKSGDTAEDADALRAELERRLARLSAGSGAEGVSPQPEP